MKSLFSKANVIRGLATSTAALLVMSGAAHAALTFGSGSLTASSALVLGDALTGTNTSTVAIYSSDWEISTTGAMTGIGSITSDGDVIFSGGDVTGAGSEKIDIGEATANAFTFTRDDAGVVTITSADDDANAGLTIGAGGTGALILGDVGSTTQMISSDWTIGATGDLAGIGAIALDGAISGGTSATFSTFVAADAYRPTNGTTVTATAALSKANLQAASYWAVDSSAGSNAAVTITFGGSGESMDAGDVGRVVLFGHTAGTGAQAIGSSDTITVTNIAAAGSGAEDVGDMISCLIATTTKVTCTTYGAD